MSVIDCTQSPSVDSLHAAGVTGVIRYLSLPQGNTVWKRITAAEYDTLRAAGLDVLLNWEYDALDWLGGAAAGTAHAAMSAQQAQALGYPAGCAIAGSCDFNITQTQWQTAGRMYAMAFSTGLRAAGYKAGVYGPWDVLGWCQQLQTFDVYWQAGMSTAWSGGRNANLWPGAHLRQRRHVTIGGIDCDYNDVIQANYGQAGGVPEMEQNDVLHSASNPDQNRGNTIGDELSDAGSMRDWLYDVPAGTASKNPPPAGSRLALLVQLAANGAPGAPTQDQVDAAVAKALPAALVTALTDPATMTELGASIVAAFKKS